VSVSRRGAGRPSDTSGASNRFIVLTGLSGAGKSQAIRALEDLGYFCVDNLPTQLIPTLAQLSLREGAEIAKVAIVADVRESSFLAEFPRVWRALRRMKGLAPVLIFLEASHETLVRRFSETRRPHPLAHDRPVVEGIRAERRRMEPVRSLADEIIDTTHLTVHELRERFMAFAAARSKRHPMVLTALSFGFKHGLPVDADLVFDVRFLPNPHFVSRLRPLTGRDAAVVRYLERQQLTMEFLKKVDDLLRFLVPLYVHEGKSYLTVAIGCTGGRHRSVMIAESIGRALRRIDGVQVRVRHRDVELT
jgi:UPF0042 nucleotide-binding protein